MVESDPTLVIFGVMREESPLKGLLSIAAGFITLFGS